MNARTIIISAYLLALCGCASYQPAPPDPVSQQCAYEAQLATANQRDSMAVTFRQVMLIDQCMRLRGK